MNNEQSRFRSRVARHAALADPARLQITDLLAVGDAAPVELQAVLGLPSNLLAHHVSVLADAGLVTRSRSLGDRRRTYQHLTADAMDGMAPAARIAVKRIVFVCTGNSARSQIAAALWPKASDIPVASAGTHPAAFIDPAAIAAAARHGLTLTATEPRAVGDVVTDDDLVVTVCDNAHEELGRASRLHWSIPDPVADGTDAAFDAAVEELARRVRTLAQHTTAA